MTRSLALAAVLGSGFGAGCTAHDPPAVEDHPRPPLTLGLMYWAPAQSLLGADGALVLATEVVELTSRLADHPEIRGPTIVEATLRVERVLHQSEHLPSAGKPPPRVRPGDRVWTDGAEGLAVGDRVLVFASDYDGGYGIVPAHGTRTPIGIVVQDWSDPIVTAVERSLRGESWSNEDEEAWRPYGKAALACRREGIPLSHCPLER